MGTASGARTLSRAARRGSATSAVSVSSTRPGRSQVSLVAHVADAVKRRVPLATASISSVNSSSVGAATGVSRGTAMARAKTVTVRGTVGLLLPMLLRSQVHHWDFKKRLMQHC